jgi:hypothetical protein
MSEQLGERAFGRVLLLCLLAFVFSAKGNLEIEDTRYSLETAQTVVNHGQLDIPDGGDYTHKGVGGKNYSKYGIGLSLYQIPWVAAGDVTSRLIHLPTGEVTGFLLSFANIPFALLTLVLFGKLLKLFGVAGSHVWLLALALGLGTPMWHYAVSDFSEAMQMCLLLLVVYGVVQGTPEAIIEGGIGFAGLFLVKLVYAPFFLLFLAYLLTRPREFRQRIRNAALFSLPVVLAGCFVVWLNVFRFGDPLESGYGAQARLFLPGQLWQTVPELLGSPDKGLFVFGPILLLGLLGWKGFASRYRPEAVLCGGVIVVNLMIAGAWYWWQGGWSWGPRLLVPAIPLWLLPAAFWLESRRSQVKYWAFAVLMLISVAAQIPGVLVKDSEIHVVKEEMLTSQERPSAPSDYVAAWMILWHKLEGRKEAYRTSEFHIPGDRELDLTGHRTFSGFNIWTEQVARQKHLPALRWLPLVALFLFGYLAIQIGATIRDGWGATAGVP